MSNGMKRVLALLYFGVLAMGCIYAQGIEFFHGTYEKMENAKNTTQWVVFSLHQ